MSSLSRSAAAIAVDATSLYWLNDTASGSVAKAPPKEPRDLCSCGLAPSPRPICCSTCMPVARIDR